MLSSMLKGGLGHVLAPDPKHTHYQNDDEPKEAGFTEGLWSIVASEPNFTNPNPNTAQDPITPTSSTPTHSFFSPQPSSTTTTLTASNERVDRLVLSAAKDLAT